jgi:hypothetical protein
MQRCIPEVFWGGHLLLAELRMVNEHFHLVPHCLPKVRFRLRPAGVVRPLPSSFVLDRLSNLFPYGYPSAPKLVL